MRLTSRGGRVPNYREDGEHYGSDFGDDVQKEGKSFLYYIDPESLVGEGDHEIEAVLSHYRHENFLDAEQDMWTENIVSCVNWIQWSFLILI